MRTPGISRPRGSLSPAVNSVQAGKWAQDEGNACDRWGCDEAIGRDFLLGLMKPVMAEKERFFVGCDVSPYVFQMYARLRGVETFCFNRVRPTRFSARARVISAGSAW